MSYIEEMAARIKRKKDRKDFDEDFSLAVMKNETECEFAGLVLDSDDYYIAGNLKDRLKAGDEVLITQLNEENYVIIAKVVKP